MSPVGAPAGDRSTGARFAACVAETVPATTTAAASELVDLRRTAQSRCSLHIRRASRGRGACSPPAHASSSPVSEIESGRGIVNATGDLNEAKERIGSDARTHIVATLTGAQEQIRMLIEPRLEKQGQPNGNKLLVPAGARKPNACAHPTCGACPRLRARPPCRRCQVGSPAQSALISEPTLTTDTSSRCTGRGWRFRTWRCVSAESLRAGTFPAPCGVQLTSFLPVKEAQVNGTVGPAALVVSPAARNVARAPARDA